MSMRFKLPPVYEPPGRHVAGPLRRLAAAISAGDRKGAEGAGGELSAVGYRLVRVTDLRAAEREREQSGGSDR
jgi:hypothetical protein